MPVTRPAEEQQSLSGHRAGHGAWNRGDPAQPEGLPALAGPLLQLYDGALSPTVFTPRVIGTAVARYNFAARDMRELSLREGDVVKIYSRIGGDQGWWKGETNGRVSLPSPQTPHSRPWASGRWAFNTGLVGD